MRTTITAVAALLAVAILVYFTRWHGQTADPGRRAWAAGAGRAVPVRVATVKSGSMDVTLDALGTVQARNTVVVRARVNGRLDRVNFQEGRQVKAGTVLAEIDPRPFQAALDQASGQLDRDTALLASARNDLARYQGLLGEDSIARQQVDDQAALVRQYQGVVQADRGAVENARLQLGWTHITAPMDGRVGLRQVDAGNMVTTADPNGVVVLTQTEPINVLFAIPADRAPEVERRWGSGAVLPVAVFARDGRTLLARGRLESADNVVDPATGTVKLKAVFDNRDGALVPNQFVNARLTVETLQGQTLVPAAAVQHGTPGTYVYAVGPGSAVQLRHVTLGAGDGDTVAVTAGLAPGERVVVDGLDKLREGMKVEAVGDAAPAPGATHGERRGGTASAAHRWRHRPAAAAAVK